MIGQYRNIEYIDLQSEAYLALCVAILSYKKKLGKLDMYLGLCCKRHLRDYISKKTIKTIQLEDNNFHFEENYKSIENKIDVSIIFSYLDEREKLILKYYMSGLTQEEISQILICTKQNINQKLLRIFHKVQEIFNESFT